MRKSRLFLAGVALLLAVFVFTGCPTGDGGSNGTPKKLTINSISSFSYPVMVVCLSDGLTEDAKLIAGGGGQVSGESVTINLKNSTGTGFNENSNWTGTGSYYILVWGSTDGNFNGSPQKYTQQTVNFSNELTTVGWADFSDMQ
jgi:hypothetical protein